MARDETEFDKLLKETREWEARDRARHKSLGMKEDGGGEAFPAPSRASTVTVEELEKRTAADLARKAAPPKMETPRPADALKVVLKTMKQAQARQQATDRAKKKGGAAWGWIWAVILLYFVIRRFLH